MRDGDAWTLAGPDENPAVISIARSPLLSRRCSNRPREAGPGASGLDDVDRMYAFATVPDHDLKVVVGLDRAEAMRSATDWEMNALLFTGGITLLIAVLAAAVAARADCRPPPP